jgi:hypothetical protein
LLQLVALRYVAQLPPGAAASLDPLPAGMTRPLAGPVLLVALHGVDLQVWGLSS